MCANLSNRFAAERRDHEARGSLKWLSQPLTVEEWEQVIHEESGKTRQPPDDDEVLGVAIKCARRVVLVHSLEDRHESGADITVLFLPTPKIAAGSAGYAPFPLPKESPVKNA